MILPSKHLSEDRALITIGADVLSLLDEPKTVSRLWNDLKRKAEAQHQDARAPRATITYDWFILGLDLLYTIGLVEFPWPRRA